MKPACRVTAVIALMAAAACGSGPEGGNGSIQPLGGQQTGQAGTDLQPYRVLVKDQSGDPEPNLTVSWGVVSGGGSITPASSLTDAQGIAEATSTLGTAIGFQKVTASASGKAGSPAAFVATITAGPPTAIDKTDGDNQGSPPGAPLPTALTVRVTDGYGNPVSGQIVSWAVTSGGGNLSATKSTTGSGGDASMRYTLGSAAGTNTVTATANSAGSVTFTAMAVPAPVLVATVPVVENYGIHDTYVRDGLVFVFAWNEGVIIYDVGNGMKGGSPGNPQFVSQLKSLGGSTHNGWWFHNPHTAENRYLFIGQEGPGAVGSSSSGDIHVVDVSDLTHPTQVATFHLSGAGVHNFWMDEDAQILYAAYYNGGVLALDVSGTLAGSLESQNRVIANVRPGGSGKTYVWGVQLYNGSLYAVDMVSGFWQLSTPQLVPMGGGNNVTERYGSDLWVANGYGYTGTWGYRATQGNTVKVWRLGAGGAPAIADSVKVTGIGTVSDLEVSDNGKVLMFSAENGPQQGVYYYSLANPAKPTFLAKSLVGSPSTGIHTASLATIGGRTYLFGARDPGGAALMIWDVTDVVQ